MYGEGIISEAEMIQKIEKIAKEYHEICREMIDKQIGLITKPTRPYLEWDELTEDMKDGRRFIAKKLMEKYILLNWQDQFDIIELRDLINKLIDGDNALGISMNWLDLKEIFEKINHES